MLNLVFIVHNHQPVGNFDFVIEDAYNSAYLPFLKTMRRFPSVKITIHFTGILIDWFTKSHPEFIELIKEMVSDGQLEIMGGGYFEPILSVLPERDRSGQLELMSKVVKEKFGSSPRGVWLAERVWEAQLAKTIGLSGAEYVLLDDSHFKSAGLSDDDLFGYYITEDEGVPLKILPGNKKLRYLIPFDRPESSIDYLRHINSKNPYSDSLVFCGDDGEKFGVWPGTHNTVYRDGWLERFFGLLEENGDWLQTATCSTVIDNHNALGNLYLPTASYAEMMEWVLPVETQRSFHSLQQTAGGQFPEVLGFMKGGFWRNFFTKYPESNNMHKKMLEVSQMLEAVKEKMPKKVFKEASGELYEGQCNCSYWHGIFGGLYLPHLRMAIYSHLIKAEKLVDKFSDSFYFKESDFLIDGSKALVIKNKRVGIYINVSRGGSVFELDSKTKEINFLGIISRRPELYHDKIKDMDASSNGGQVQTIHEITRLKEDGLGAFLNYDSYRRGSFIEHFFHDGQTPTLFRDGKLEEKGDFVQSPYTCTVKKRSKKISALLSRDGNVSNQPLRLNKSMHVEKDGNGLEADYTLLNTGDTDIHCNFAVEFCVNPLYQNPDTTYIKLNDKRYGLRDTGSDENVYRTEINIDDIETVIAISSDQEAAVWRSPIETISQAESGIERNYQGTSFLLIWPIHLPPGQGWKVKLKKIIECR